MNLIKRILSWLVSIAPMWALLIYVNTSINLVQNSIVLCHSWYVFSVISYSVAGFSDFATNRKTTSYSLPRSHQLGLSSFTSIRAKTSFKIALFCAIMINELMIVPTLLLAFRILPLLSDKWIELLAFAIPIAPVRSFLCHVQTLKDFIQNCIVLCHSFKVIVWLLLYSGFSDSAILLTLNMF
jgi:hypothetical protein